MRPPLCMAASILGLGTFGLIGCGADLNSTDCYADFPSKKAASRVIATAKAHGLRDIELVSDSRRPSIRVSSAETGAEAEKFRSTVQRLVRQGGGHLEKNTPCLERPPFN
jgi:hypothetical protein